MESVTLVDGARIRALGIFQTFDSEGGEILWNRKECAYKFLVINSRLVIGPIGDHSELYAVYHIWDHPAGDEAKEKVHTIAREQWSSKRNYSVSAAGMIGSDGRVTGWKSECFRIETPMSMRAEIEQEVMRLFQAGELRPR